MFQSQLLDLQITNSQHITCYTKNSRWWAPSLLPALLCIFESINLTASIPSFELSSEGKCSWCQAKWGGAYPERGQTWSPSCPPYTPQVLCHCLAERAHRTQTQRISVWLSMSPGAEPIGGDKEGLIALSSASQREAFSTWTVASAALHIPSISSSGPRLHLPCVSLYLCFSLSLPPSLFLGPLSLSSGRDISSLAAHSLVGTGLPSLHVSCSRSDRFQPPSVVMGPAWFIVFLPLPSLSLAD